MSKALLIPVSGKPELFELPEDGGTLRETLGGSFEGLQGPNGGIAYINAYGKLEGLEVNQFATMVMTTYLMASDYIAGPIVICGKVDREGRDTDINSDVANLIIHGWTVYAEAAGIDG